jgi:hypothetical protein
MRTSFQTRKDGSMAIDADAEAARVIFASVLFAARFHDTITPLVPVAQKGTRCCEGRTSMPMTYAEHDKKMKVPAVCELLPLRDLPQGDNVMVRTNGAFVAGYELKGVLSYFATDEDRNQSKSMLEALIRGVPDVSMRIHFRYEISEHLGVLFDDYVNQQRTQKSEVMALDAHRLKIWKL